MVKSTKLPKNQIGTLYATIKDERKLAFRLALLKAGNNDGENYMKRFLDYWQYSETYGGMPSCMVLAAMEHLDFQLSPKPQNA